ncbi:MAG: hypothetical protein AAFV33_09175 [Chloroflexota bacterium]
MSYRVYIDETHPHIIHNVYSGEVTLDDYYDVIEQTYSMIREQDITVHTILRYENVISRPPNTMQPMRYASRNMPANLGLRVVVADNTRGRFSAAMINIGRQLGLALTENVAIVRTLAEAYEVIASQPPN